MGGNEQRRHEHVRSGMRGRGVITEHASIDRIRDLLVRDGFALSGSQTTSPPGSAADGAVVGVEETASPVRGWDYRAGTVAFADGGEPLLSRERDRVSLAINSFPTASDGLVARGKGHPRRAGSYARVLSRYVRSQGRLSLMDAIRKASLMPAQRLEGAAAEARRKGRLQEGADADVAVFDPATVQDRATYERPAEPSVGFRYVLVGGVPVVDGGKVVEGVFTGRALVRAAP